MCVFLFDFRECEGTGALFECLIRTQVLRGPLTLCQECGWVGSRDFYAQIWELTRHHGHMGSMLDADWSRQILLRCDWSVLCRAYHTTDWNDRVRDDPDDHMETRLYAPRKSHTSH